MPHARSAWSCLLELDTEALHRSSGLFAIMRWISRPRGQFGVPCSWQNTTAEGLSTARSATVVATSSLRTSFSDTPPQLTTMPVHGVPKRTWLQEWPDVRQSLQDVYRVAESYVRRERERRLKHHIC